MPAEIKALINGLALREHTLVLLAASTGLRQSEIFGSEAADAPGAQRWPSGVEITESLRPARGFRLSIGEAQRSQAARSGRRAEEDTASVQEDWRQWCGLAYVQTHSGIDASGDGRTPTHDPRLLEAQQPPRHEQIPAGDVEDQASGTRQVGRCLLACGLLPKPNLIQ
jgi:hypothetical protein